MSDKKRRLVAYHEAGHALVGALMPEYDPVTKISIVPRGAAGGLTFFAPSEERLESGLYSRTYFENQVGAEYLQMPLVHCRAMAAWVEESLPMLAALP
jgi:ATP-dependent Zn protease